MTPDTPLPEVVRHLPRDAAQLLSVQVPYVQETVLKQVRNLMCFWEESGADFDPIQWELVLNGVVATATPLVLELLNREVLNAMLLGGE